MTARYEYPTYWASGGSVTDPDTDTTHTSYIPNRYSSLGWIAEKPPNDWDNFLYQVTDEKIMWLLQEGIPTWDASVAYAVGSITRVGEVLYKNISSSPSTNNAPATSPTVWGVIFGIDATSFNAAVNLLTTTLANHLSADNPHNDDIHTIGGYLATETFAMFDDVTDPRTIKYHTARNGAVHNETALQVGTLPVSGGTFTGDVHFLQNVAFNAGKTIYVRLSQATGRAELHMGSVTLAVDTLGNVYFNDGTRDYLIVTVANFDLIQIKVNGLFALPQPAAIVDTTFSLSSSGCSPVVLSSTSDAAFDSSKGLALVGLGLTASGLNFNFATTAYISGYNSAGPVRELYDSTTSQYANLGDFLTSTTVSKFTYLKQITIFPMLSAYQKSTLAV